MKIVLVMFKGKERREFPLEGENTVIGRRPDCGLRIPTGDVSRQHCEIVVGEEVLVRDLGSSNGTYVNGKRIAESKLDAGDQLGVGPIVFVVQIDGRPAEITPEDIEAIAALGGDGDDSDILDLDDLDIELDDDEVTKLDVLDDEDDDK